MSALPLRKRPPTKVANREKCEDFSKFKPLFDMVQKELDTGLRETRPFEMADRRALFHRRRSESLCCWEKGETITNEQGRTDARLRVIFDNGTESNMLMRSLQRALNKDDAGRRITDPSAGPLFRTRPSMAMRRAGSSMCFVASQIIRSSQKTGNWCTRSASQI